ncbi:MAG TPA: MmcQ/YjbR family DNA-binding protein [Phototrophicaceae bacterium]|nr:MmcQ/YjbR family DNA-binding protein [Phototrophicaceae bacterium]
MATGIDLKRLQSYCADKHGAVADYPFGEDTLVFKVMGKIFALLPINLQNEPPQINLKCDPVFAEILRNMYDAVQPGYHMNKKHWNTVIADGSIPDDELYEMIEQSYDLVVKSLKKDERERLKKLP